MTNRLDLGDFYGRKLESTVRFSTHSAVKSCNEPLEDFVICAETFVVVFCDHIALYHKR